MLLLRCLVFVAFLHLSILGVWVSRFALGFVIRYAFLGVWGCFAGLLGVFFRLRVFTPGTLGLSSRDFACLGRFVCF